MNSFNKILGLILIITLLSAFTGPVIAGNYLLGGGYFSTDTSVSGEGTVNQTFIIEQITKKNGTIEGTRWTSSQTLIDPIASSWNSKMTFEVYNTSIGWDFNVKGLPTTWNKISTFGPKDEFTNFLTPPRFPSINIYM